MSESMLGSPYLRKLPNGLGSRSEPSTLTCGLAMAVAGNHSPAGLFMHTASGVMQGSQKGYAALNPNPKTLNPGFTQRRLA